MTKKIRFSSISHAKAICVLVNMGVNPDFVCNYVTNVWVRADNPKLKDIITAVKKLYPLVSIGVGVKKFGAIETDCYNVNYVGAGGVVIFDNTNFNYDTFHKFLKDNNFLM